MLYDREGDALEDGDRAALHRSLRRGIAEADAGQLVDADDVLAAVACLREESFEGSRQ